MLKILSPNITIIIIISDKWTSFCHVAKTFLLSNFVICTYSISDVSLEEYLLFHWDGINQGI